MTQLAKYMYKAGVGKEALQLMQEDLEGSEQSNTNTGGNAR